jgi:uncharacterized membrane protein YkvI
MGSEADSWMGMIWSFLIMVGALLAAAIYTVQGTLVPVLIACLVGNLGIWLFMRESRKFGAKLHHQGNGPATSS